MTKASFLVALVFFFSSGAAVACDPNESCASCVLRSPFTGGCAQYAIDPKCEVRKAVCSALTPASPANTALATASGDGISRQTSTFQDNFLRYDYAETKDLSKSFLTLVAAILVFSLTFSEKIVDFTNAKKLSRISLITSWSLFLLSIISCGVSLCLISLAGGNALYGGDYLSLAVQAWAFLLLAGSFFAIGLIALIIAAIASISKRPLKNIDG